MRVKPRSVENHSEYFELDLGSVGRGLACALILVEALKCWVIVELDLKQAIPKTVPSVLNLTRGVLAETWDVH